MRYGLPYKGSKNQIAERVVDNLPGADTFCDLFFGGGAITHRALLSGKYKHFIANDIDPRLTKLFVDCANGKYTLGNHTEWISREEFNARKNDDAYIALVWSFGNNGMDYMYGKDIEDYKKAFHYACFYNDLTPLVKFGINLKMCETADVYKRYLDYSHQVQNFKHNQLENLTRLQALEHLQSLQSLQSFGTDYQNIVIPDNSVIYCDIPYNQSNCGKYKGFDHKRFYEWAEQQDNIYISEYAMPDTFIPIAWRSKQILSAANGNDTYAEEMIFTNRRTYEKLSDDEKLSARLNFGKQMTLFDFGGFDA